MTHPVAGAPAVVLLLDRIARARVVEAFKGICTVEFVDRTADLLARVVAGPVSFVVVEPRDRERAPAVPAVETIRRGYPSIPVIAYVCPGHTQSAEILSMAQAGVHELIMQGFDDFGITLRTVAESALRHCAATRILDELSADLPTDAVPLVRYCLERSWEKPGVITAARYLGVNRKTLVYRTERDLGMPPSALIGWCRLFLAATMLEDPYRSVSQVAMALDFGSSAALRGMLRRYVGLRPQELRERGGLGVVVGAFRRQLGARGTAGEPAPGVAAPPAAGSIRDDAPAPA